MDRGQGDGAGGPVQRTQNDPVAVQRRHRGGHDGEADAGGGQAQHGLHQPDPRQVRYGPETMCIGDGQGLAAVFERV